MGGTGGVAASGGGGTGGVAASGGGGTGGVAASGGGGTGGVAASGKGGTGRIAASGEGGTDGIAVNGGSGIGGVVAGAVGVGNSMVRMPGTISPKQQKEVDRQTWHDLDEDFLQQKQAAVRREKYGGSGLGKSGGEAKEREVVELDDSSSDFESPLLLKRARNFGPLPQPSASTPKTEIENAVEAEIEDFDSPPFYPGLGAAATDVRGRSRAEVNIEPVAAKPSTKANSAVIAKTAAVTGLKKKAENRWGLQGRRLFLGLEVTGLYLTLFVFN